MGNQDAAGLRRATRANQEVIRPSRPTSVGGRKTQRKKKAVPRQSRRRKYSHQKQQVFRSGQTKSLERFESKIVGRTLSPSKKGEETGQTQTRAARCQRTKSKTHTTAPSIALSPRTGNAAGNTNCGAPSSPS